MLYLGKRLVDLEHGPAQRIRWLVGKEAALDARGGLRNLELDRHHTQFYDGAPDLMKILVP